LVLNGNLKIFVYTGKTGLPGSIKLAVDSSNSKVIYWSISTIFGSEKTNDSIRSVKIISSSAFVDMVITLIISSMHIK
jgi:hypothetical protein